MHSYIHTLCFRLTNFDNIFVPMQATSGSIHNSTYSKAAHPQIAKPANLRVK